MELKPGYKQTEVGVIPEAWEVRTLGSLTSLLTNGFVGTATSAYVDNDDGVLYIQGYNIQENGFNFHGIKRISKSFHARNQKSCLQPGDLLTIQTGDIGVTAVVPPVLAGSNCHALVISRLDKRVSEPGFYCQYFNSDRGRVAFKGIETGSTMKHLNVGDMKRLFLPSPPIEEQSAMAEALSHADTLIGALDQLISKKGDLKQAAMQQLLTGQTRLPGFGGEWEAKPGYQQTDVGIIPDDWDVSPFGDLFSIGAGGDVDPKRSALNQDETYCYPIYSNALTNRGLYGYCSYADHQAGSITITARGTLGWANFRDHPYTAIGRVLVLQPKKEVAARFFAEVINNRVKFAIESTGVPQLTAPQISIYRLPVPPLPEQTAIAEVLSDMDANLAGLEQRLAKTRALKQSMMQELLTGRTRLI